MTPSKAFEHRGTVAEIRENLIKIKMQVTEACGACKAKNICGSTSAQERELEIHTHTQQFTVGEEVNVVINIATGFKAIFFSYIIPTLLLLGTLFTIMAITHKEGLSALIALLILATYFFILYLQKDRIINSLSIQVRKIGNQ